MHVVAVVLWIGGVGMVTTVEPLFHERLLRRFSAAPEETFHVVERLHRVLLVLSLLTIAGAVAGSPGINLLSW